MIYVEQLALAATLDHPVSMTGKYKILGAGEMTTQIFQHILEQPGRVPD